MSIDEIWNQSKHLEFSTQEPPTLCPFGRKFSDWAKALCSGVHDDANIAAINRAKVLLLDKYFDWRSVVPKTHRHHAGVSGHQCILHVLIESYEFLRALELSLTPPAQFFPAPSSLPEALPPPQIAGIFIGEIDE
jgi:hypothetical protein